MKKSNKIKKKTKDEINIINSIKIYVNKYSSKVNFVRSIDFKEQADKDSLRLDAVLDCGSFNLSIVYYPFMLVSEHNIDAEITFENSAYTYTFYDIFNLFDINDFNLYYYSDMLSFEDVERAVKGIFEAVEKHLYYIEKAQTAEYLPLLEKNYETDMTAVTGDDSWKEEEKDLFFLPFNHPMWSFADGAVTPKLHKKLRKKSDKGKLDTIYEERLLKYLDSGAVVERKSISQKSDFEKLYRRKLLVMTLTVFIPALIIVPALSMLVQSVIFKGAEVFGYGLSVFGIQTQIPILSLLSAFLFAAFILLGFGKKLLVKSMPDDMKESAKAKYEKEQNGNSGRLAKPLNIIASVILILCSAATFIFSLDDIGYYDDYVKFSNSLSFIEVKYEDVNIYKLMNVYDGDEDPVPAENAYLISDDNGNYFEYGEINPNGKTQAKLNEIAEKYNKEIIEVESIDYVPNI